MTEHIKEILGSEYSVALEREIEKLKQSEKMLIGDIVAVVRRSDKNMGRPIEDCTAKNEADYVIFKPSKYAIVCQKNIEVIKSANSDIKLMSLSYFVDQLLEFNFTFLQILLCGEVKYESAEFIKLRNEIRRLTYIKSCNMYKKQTSLLHGVLGDINKKKVSEKQLEDRLFLVYKVMCMLERYTNESEWELDNNLDTVEYNRIVKNFDDSVLNELNCRLGKIVETENSRFVFEDKQVYASNRLLEKYEILNQLVLDTLEV